MTTPGRGVPDGTRDRVGGGTLARAHALLRCSIVHRSNTCTYVQALRIICIMDSRYAAKSLIYLGSSFLTEASTLARRERGAGGFDIGLSR
jgi:hypothetical protein